MTSTAWRTHGTVAPMAEFARIEELEFRGIYARGLANRERIVLRARDDLDLDQYALVIGRAAPGGRIRILRNHFYQFPADQVVDRGTWIFIYTGSGELRTTRSGGVPALVWHLGAPTTLFAEPQRSCAVFHIDGILLEPR